MLVVGRCRDIAVKHIIPNKERSDSYLLYSIDALYISQFIRKNDISENKKVLHCFYSTDN